MTQMSDQELHIETPLVESLPLFHDIRNMTLRGGADFFGVGDLTPVRDAVVAQGGESLAAFPRAIAMGIALSDDIVDLLVQHGDARIARHYTAVYEDTNRTLDQIAASVADRLRTAGATALAVRASRRIDQERLCGLFSHKMAAHLAGLGWIGKNCLLVTREAGPRVRWTTVLTNTLLPPTGGPAEQACGDCRRCVDACPAGAFTGEPFRAEESRDVRFAARKCESYGIKMWQEMGCRVLCGLCVAVCPHGKRRDAQNNAMHRTPLARRL